MKIISCLYINIYTFYVVPKAYTKYLWLCLSRGEFPEYEMLAKFMMLYKIARELRANRIVKWK